MSLPTIDLRHHLLLRVSGADAERYLQGQITQDTQQATAERAAWSTVCTHQGKMQAFFTLARHGAAFYLSAEASLADTLPARLERYAISDEVVFEVVTGQLSLLHFLSRPADLPPGAHYRQISRFGVPGWDVFLPAEADMQAWALQEEATLEPARIQAGWPRWGRELDADTLPPEALLEASCISYTKGCYAGQEVISRMKTAGKVNRRLTRFSLENCPAELPQPILLENGSEAGKLTSAAAGWGLGFLKKSAWAASGLTVAGNPILALA
jgi:folate-binding protein YgfZ